MASVEEEECPVCREKISNSSQPTQCCHKLICQRCLNHSFRYRPHCPFCRRSAPMDARLPLQIRPNSFQRVASRPIGLNIENIIGQLQNAQTDAANQVNPPNRAAPQNPSLLPSIPVIRPTPMPRPRLPRLNALPLISPSIPSPNPPSNPPSIPPPNPPSFSPSPLPRLEPLSPALLHALVDAWLPELDFQEIRQLLPRLITRTFVCPYCQENGFDELQLQDHCNNNHRRDRRRVVCPVCVETPHGDRQYVSRDFIAHLNLRHRYYLEDITNLHQTDDVNLQCAILESLNPNM